MNSSPHSKSRIYAGEYFHQAEAWVLNWLQEAGKLCWRHAQPTVVLTPNPTLGARYRALLAEHGIGHLGIRFWTIGDLRQFLTDAQGGESDASPVENIHLLLAIAADASDTPLSRSIAGDPARLAKLLQLTEGAGADSTEFFAESIAPELEEIVGRYQAIRQAAGIASTAQVDRKLGEWATGQSLIRRLLIVGFHGGHWADLPLLETAAKCAEEVDVLVEQPFGATMNLDVPWVGTWEERLGTIAEPWLATESEASATTSFLVAPGARALALAIVGQVARWMQETPQARIGILFPTRNALAREVALALAAANLTHYDSFGGRRASLPEEDAWRAWIEFQSRPAAGVWLDLREALGDDIRKTARILDRAASDLLTDDFEALAAWLAANGRPLSEMPERLPASAPLKIFARRTEVILNQFGWVTRARMLATRYEALKSLANEEVGRDIWLRWLQAALEDEGLVRQPSGIHLFSRIHLLRYDDAEGSNWSHLLFAGLNEDVWPARIDERPFFGDSAYARWNETVRNRNRSVIESGAQGEGHEAVEAGRTLCLGPQQKRQLLDRLFESLCASVSCSICAAASLYDEARPSLESGPSTWFQRLWQAAHPDASPLSAGEFRDLCGEPSREDKTRPRVFEDIARARKARIDPDTSFGPYQFSRTGNTEAPSRPVTFWEKAIAGPAGAWMELFLNVESPIRFDVISWQRTIGTWAHRWVAAGIGAGDWHMLPDLPTACSAARAKAEAFRAQVMDSLNTLPPWWESSWIQSLAIAEALLEQVVQHWSGFLCRAEFAVESPQLINLQDGAQLRLFGKMDFVATRQAREIPEECHVIDFKTGGSGEAKIQDVRRGIGLQLPLYLLLLNAAGTRDASGAIIQPFNICNPVQITLEDALGEIDTWRVLARMQGTGVFGQRETGRERFGRTFQLPMAMLFIDPDVLESKWLLTHPEFAR